MQIKLKVRNQDKLIFNYVPVVMKAYLNQMYIDKKAESLNTYIKEILNLNKWDVKSILRYAINNLIIIKEKDGYIVKTPDHLPLADTGHTISSLLDLIENGNLEVNKYPILPKIFNYIQRKIKILIPYYYVGLGGK